MHGQSDIDEADDRHFFIYAVNKSVHDAMLHHNTAFLNTFHNTMKEVFHGYPIDQVGLAYYNIPYPLTQGTNQAGTSHQEAAPTGNDDVHATADGASSESNGYFGKACQIPSLAQKIAPSVQRIHRDIDPNIYNQRFQVESQQMTQLIEIPQGYPYGTDYNTHHMIPNLGYQGTRDFNPQMGQQV